MNTQPISATSIPLQFTDSAGCKRWIDQLTPTNVQLTQQVLTGQLASLDAAPLAPLERLKILETLREPVHFVQNESAKRYVGKPLPLEAGESAVWENVIAWHSRFHLPSCLGSTSSPTRLPLASS